MSRRFSRRSFAMSAGATMLLAPFMRFAKPAKAVNGLGAEGVAKRLIIFFTPNGTIHKHFTNWMSGLINWLGPFVGAQ